MTVLVTMQENTTPDAPWLREEAFPQKPPDSEYGYIDKRKLVPCTREELIRISGLTGFAHVNLVWHPDAPRIVPAQQTPFLADALKERQRKRLQSASGWGTLAIILYSFDMCIRGKIDDGTYFYLLLILGIGVVPVVQSTYELQKLKRLKRNEALEDSVTSRYQAWVLSHPARFTWVLLGVVILIFCFEVLHPPEAIAAAGLDKHAVWRGEWWRLFTGPLMHGGLMHLFFNAAALMGLGRLVELLSSRYHVVVVFTVSALCGSIFSLFLLPNTTSVGASGGLMGLIGFLGILGLRRKKLLPPGFVKSVAINIAIIAIMGILAFKIIDNAAHFGGLVGGAMMGLLLVPREEQKLPLSSGWVVKALGVLTLAVTAFFGLVAMTKIALR